MRSAIGGFIGELDEKLQLKDARVHVPVRRDVLIAKSLRVRIMLAGPKTPEGRVSAVVKGTNGSLARIIYPKYMSFWEKREVPQIPRRMDEGSVTDEPFLPGACMPEIERCKGDSAAKPIPLNNPVTSEGFLVILSLSLSGYEPGTEIRGVVALSDE